MQVVGNGSLQIKAGVSQLRSYLSHRVGWVRKSTFWFLSREAWVAKVHMPQAKNKSALRLEKQFRIQQCPLYSAMTNWQKPITPMSHTAPGYSELYRQFTMYQATSKLFTGINAFTCANKPIKSALLLISNLRMRKTKHNEITSLAPDQHQ